MKRPPKQLLHSQKGESDAVDLDDCLVSLSAPAADDEGGNDDDGHHNPGDHGGVACGLPGFVDGTDDLASLGLNVISCDGQLASSDPDDASPVSSCILHATIPAAPAAAIAVRKRAKTTHHSPSGSSALSAL